MSISCESFDTFIYTIGSTPAPLQSIISIIPLGIFASFMLINLPKSLKKLKSTESLIVPTYYYVEWIIILLSLVRVIITLISSNTSLWKTIILDYIFLFFFHLVQFAVLIFMLHRDAVSGREAIRQTILISLVIASCLEALQIFLVLLLNVNVWPPAGDNSTVVISYWLTIHGIIAIIYLIFYIVPKTRLRGYVPGHSAFSSYVGFLFIVYFFHSIGDLLILLNYTSGFCFTATARIIDWGFFSAVIYFCFLHKYLKDLYLPQAFMEMDQQGYLNTDT